MTYQNARKFEICDAHSRHIEEFARTYKRNRPTIVLIPSGIGTQIDRSIDSYRGNASLPLKKWEPAWIDLGLLFGHNMLKLEIQPNGHDLHNHICIPKGPLRFIVEPYKDAADFFRQKDYNYIVFAYDWRQPVVESAFFLEFFLKLLKSRVQDLRFEDPLPQTTILGHGMGGLVAYFCLYRWFKQNSTADIVQKWMTQLVTVATPFFGTATHIMRYYKGLEPLNIIYGVKPLAALIGSLPGPYILMLMDRKTYARNADKLEIDRYPVRDASNRDLEADPYDENLFDRYPPWVNHDYIHLATGLRNSVAKPLADAVVERVFHFRARNMKTWVELGWEAIDGAQFNPSTDDCPISGLKGDGDGTVPWWSARLPQVPDSQVFNLNKARSHQELLDHQETLNGIHQLIENGKLPKTIQAPEKPLGRPKSSLPAIKQFIEEISTGRKKIDDLSAQDTKLLRRVIQEVNLC